MLAVLAVDWGSIDAVDEGFLACPDFCRRILLQGGRLHGRLKRTVNRHKELLLLAAASPEAKVSDFALVIPCWREDVDVVKAFFSLPQPWTQGPYEKRRDADAAALQLWVELVPEKIRKNADVLRTMVLQGNAASRDGMLFAPPELLEDRGFVLSCVGVNGDLLRHAPLHLREDQEVVQAALRNSCSAAKYLGPLAREGLRRYICVCCGKLVRAHLLRCSHGDTFCGEDELRCRFDSAFEEKEWSVLKKYLLLHGCSVSKPDRSICCSASAPKTRDLTAERELYLMLHTKEVWYYGERPEEASSATIEDLVQTQNKLAQEARATRRAGAGCVAAGMIAHDVAAAVVPPLLALAAEAAHAGSRQRRSSVKGSKVVAKKAALREQEEAAKFAKLTQASVEAIERRGEGAGSEGEDAGLLLQKRQEEIQQREREKRARRCARHASKRAAKESSKMAHPVVEALFLEDRVRRR